MTFVNHQEEEGAEPEKSGFSAIVKGGQRVKGTVGGIKKMLFLARKRVRHGEREGKGDLYCTRSKKGEEKRNGPIKVSKKSRAGVRRERGEEEQRKTQRGRKGKEVVAKYLWGEGRSSFLRKGLC